MKKKCLNKGGMFNRYIIIQRELNLKENGKIKENGNKYSTEVELKSKKQEQKKMKKKSQNKTKK